MVCLSVARLHVSDAVGLGLLAWGPERRVDDALCVMRTVLHNNVNQCRVIHNFYAHEQQAGAHGHKRGSGRVRLVPTNTRRSLLGNTSEGAVDMWYRYEYGESADDEEKKERGEDGEEGKIGRPRDGMQRTSEITASGIVE